MNELFSNTNMATTISRKILVVVLVSAIVAVAASVYAYLSWSTPAPSALPVETANEMLAFSLADYATIDGVFCKAPVTGVTRVLNPQQLEDMFGVRIRLVGVTAGGGLIDLRYRVVDLAKALPLLGSHETMPSLVDKESEIVLQAPDTMMHHDALKQDRTYFMHYPNAGNSVKPGSEVAVVMGDIRVEWIMAQ
jgi:hypothetical protein